MISSSTAAGQGWVGGAADCGAGPYKYTLLFTFFVGPVGGLIRPTGGEVGSVQPLLAERGPSCVVPGRHVCSPGKAPREVEVGEGYGGPGQPGAASPSRGQHTAAAEPRTLTKQRPLHLYHSHRHGCAWMIRLDPSSSCSSFAQSGGAPRPSTLWKLT